MLDTTSAQVSLRQASEGGRSDRMNEPAALLSIRELRVWFELHRFGLGHAGYVHAVDGVSVARARGEAIAVVGESGGGKSSLMKTILGLPPAREGKVIFDGV